MMRSPCASAAETGAGQRRPTAGASGSEVTSQTAIRAAAARALQAPPALWACTMSMRSAVTRLSRIRAFLRSRIGLRAALGRFIHSPPNALSSPTSGPSSAAIRARAPACSRAKATLRAARVLGSSYMAGTICNMVAPASVRRGTRVPSKPSLTAVLPSGSPACRSWTCGGQPFSSTFRGW